MTSLHGSQGLIHGDTPRERTVALHQLFDDALDELEITYDVYYRIDLYRPRCIHIVDWVLRKGIDNGDVLMLGVYTRPLAMLFGKLGFSVTEVDVRVQSEVGMDIEKGVGLRDLARTLTDMGQDFAVIVCDDLLQYFSSPRASLGIMTRLLQNEGVLLLITANVARGSSRAQLLRGRNVYPWVEGGEWRDEGTGGDHNEEISLYREYTLREVQSVVSESGLQVEDSGYIIGKKPIDNNQPSMSVGEYLAKKLYQGVQLIVPPLRSHLFVAARKDSVR